MAKAFQKSFCISECNRIKLGEREGRGKRRFRERTEEKKRREGVLQGGFLRGWGRWSPTEEIKSHQAGRVVKRYTIARKENRQKSGVFEGLKKGTKRLKHIRSEELRGG